MISAHHFAPIAALDLDPIRIKLMQSERGDAWSADKADAVERDYRRFLYLMKMFPNEPTAPPVEVDRYWRLHITETRKYAADCALAFGYFLHRFASLGLRGEGDEDVRRRCGERMRELYEETFGEGYAGAESDECAFSSASTAACCRASAASTA